MTATLDVQRQFIQVGERRVLLRHAGSGPAVVLLHQSPESSGSLLPWFDALADRFAVFAPDTPGFGLSDPLALAQPTIPELAAALGRLLDALGLQRVLLYGVHTGAAIAARLAHDQPQRVAALVCDGLSAFSAAERQPLLDGYLPPFEPHWDGTHLLWLWARIREQTLYFPWHVGTATARLAYPLATPNAIHKSVMELLDAGDGYRAGYRAPLLYEHGAATAGRLRVPSWLLYRRADVLRPHLDRLPPLPPDVTASEVADVAALTAATLAAFDEHADRAARVDSAGCVQRSASTTRRIVATAVGELALRCERGSGTDGVIDVVLPDIGTPAALPADAAPLAALVTVELPGHGASARIDATAVASGAWLATLLPAIDSLHGSGRPLRLHASGASCAFAATLALQLGPRCAGLNLTDPLPLDAAERERLLAGLPHWQPQASGAHLIEAWNWARLRHLFKPWLAPTADNAVITAAPPPHRVHADTVEMLRAGPLLRPLWHAALHADPWPALTAGTLPLQLQSSPDAHALQMAQRLSAAGGLQRGADSPAGCARWWRPLRSA